MAHARCRHSEGRVTAFGSQGCVQKRCLIFQFPSTAPGHVDLKKYPRSWLGWTWMESRGKGLGFGCSGVPSKEILHPGFLQQQVTGYGKALTAQLWAVSAFDCVPLPMFIQAGDCAAFACDGIARDIVITPCPHHNHHHHNHHHHNHNNHTNRTTNWGRCWSLLSFFCRGLSHP